MLGMFKKIFGGAIFGDANARYLKKIQPLVVQINDLEQQFSSKSDEELKALRPKFAERLANGETLEDILPEAFAAVREAAKRTLKQRHFDVQLLGGIALHNGFRTSPLASVYLLA